MSPILGKLRDPLKTCILEHATQHNTSADAQHFSQHEHTQVITDLYNQNARPDNPMFFPSITTNINNIILNNYKILYSNKCLNSNQLLLTEALYIKFNKPELNTGLKANKELTLFCSLPTFLHVQVPHAFTWLSSHISSMMSSCLYIKTYVTLIQFHTSII